MRRLGLVLMAALALASCGKKEEKVSLNRPQPKLPGPQEPSYTPPPGAALTPASAEDCAVVGTYVKHELAGDMGLPLMYRVAADPNLTLKPSVLEKSFPKLKGAEADGLAKAFEAGAREGRQFDCDWKGMGVMPPVMLQPAGKDFLRFRSAVFGEVAVLESFTSAGEIVAAGTRCLYRKDGGAWVRGDCVLTAFD